MSRPERRRGLRCAVGALAIAALSTGPGGGTLAAFTDYAVLPAGASADSWTPDPPAECGPMKRYVAVVHGTPGPDEFVGDGRPKIYMGLGGDDVLTSSKAPDCLVGGPGRDVLIGNPASILVGDAEDMHVWQPPPKPPVRPGNDPRSAATQQAPQETAAEQPGTVAPDDTAAPQRPAPAPPPVETPAPAPELAPTPPPAPKPAPEPAPAPTPTDASLTPPGDGAHASAGQD